MAGRFAQITKSNEATKKKHADSSYNASALRNEKVTTIKQDVQRAPALSVPENNIKSARTNRPQNEQKSGGRFQQIMDTARNVGQALQDFPAEFTDSISFGLSNAAGRLLGVETQAEQDERNQRIGGKVGEIAGYVMPGAAIERGVAMAAKPLLNKLPRLGQLATTGTAAGLIEGAAQEGADVAFRGGTFDPVNVAISGAAGGVLNPAADLAGQGIQRLLKTFRPQAVAQTPQGPTLALPEPRQRGNMNTVQTPDVINASGKVEPIGLPQPNIVPPTTARVARQVNPARQKLEAFAQAMQGAQLPPGREREVFLDAWGRFAGPDDPDLETMIDLAYSSRPRQVAPDAIQRARETQRMREVSGVGMPVRSMDDRYQGGVQSSAAMPETVVGRRGASPAPGRFSQIARQPEAAAQTDQATRASIPSQRMNEPPTTPLQPMREVSQPSKRVPEIGNQQAFTPPPRSELSELRQRKWSGQQLTEAEEARYNELLDTIDMDLTPSSSTPLRESADDVPNLVEPSSTVQEVAQAAKQDWFSKLFGNQGVGIIPGFRRGGRNTLTSEGQIVDNPIKNTVSGAWETTKAAGRSTYQNFVDMNDPIKNISKEAYDASMDANRANQLANVIVSDKFVTPEGQVVGEGLQNTIRKIGRGNYNAFTDYLILRHAKTRMARGENVYDKKLEMTPEKVQERIDFLESRHPHFNAIGKEWDNYYRNLRNVYGVDGDLMPKSLASHLERENPHYASNRRQFSNLEKIKGANNFGQPAMFSGQKAPLQKVSPTGSHRKIVDPVRSAVEQTGAWVNATMRNRVMKEIVNKISADPASMKGIAEVVQPPKGSPNLKQILDEHGEEGYLEMLHEEFNKLFKRGSVNPDNVVRAMIKGEPVYVKVHDVEAVKALLGMGAEQANIALSIMNAFSNTVKQGATGVLAPLFAVRGATMDVAQALIQADNPIKHVPYLFGAIASSIGDALKIPGLRNMAQDFYRAGGGYSAALRGERALKKNVGRMRLDPLLHPRTIAKGVGRTIAAPYKASIKVADIAENMNRIAAYNYKLRQLGGEPTEKNIREAMNYAREITTNYSRRGRQSQMLESIIPYNNAAVQGMYRFTRAWKKNPVKTAAMVGVGVLAPKAYEYIQFHDDEDYKRLPARERYRNLITSKNPDGTFNKIPLPPEYNALGAFMVDVLRAYNDGDPDAFKGATDSIVNAFTPPAVSGGLQGLTQGGGVEQSGWGVVNSTSVGPVLGALGNQTFYGAPVESLKVSDRSPANRYDERTTAPAKWLGKQLNWSPMKIDYILRAYGGDPARLLLPITSDVGAGRPKQAVLKNFIVDPVLTNTITDDFYRGKELLGYAYRDNQEVDAPLPKWYSEDLRKLVTSTAKGSASKQISELNEQKRTIQADKSLTAEQKAQKIRDIQAQLNDIMIEVNAKMKEAGVPILNR